MINYISCDLYRLLRRFFRWLMVLLILFLLASITALLVQAKMFGESSSFAYVTAIKSMIKPLSLIVGGVEILFVFGDDLKAKTVQAAIGTGLPRWKLITGKYLEIAILSFLDVVIYGVFIVVLGPLFAITLLPSQMVELLIYMFTEWLRIIGYVALTMPVVFVSGSIGIGLVLFIALFAKILYYVMDIILSMDAIAHLHLERYTLTSSIETIQTCLIGGVSVMSPLLVVLAYCVIGWLLTILFFNKKELQL